MGRKVNPTVYTPDEMAKRLAQDNAFVTLVLEQPKIRLIGSEAKLDGEYGGMLDVNERLVADLIAATQTVAHALGK